MKYIWYVVAGLSGGLLGGMGMGGGTALIPLLSIFYNVSQHSAQAVNLISFVPMAVVALLIHIKNKLLEFDKAFVIILSGLATCVLGCYLARAMSANLLKRFFGGFLLVLSVFQLVVELRKKEK